MKSRWMIEKKRATRDNEILQVVEVYAPHEKLKVVKRENKDITYEVEQLKVAQ